MDPLLTTWGPDYYRLSRLNCFCPGNSPAYDRRAIGKWRGRIKRIDGENRFKD